MATWQRVRRTKSRPGARARTVLPRWRPGARPWGRAKREAAPPAIPIQVNALQAMCRQVFGFRLAMIALATP
ncbi:hypothetical protein FNH09_43405, partial [Streptomyces adustus]